MHVRLDAGLAVPAESSVRKVDMNAETFIQRLPNAGDLFALRDAVCGHQRCAYLRTLHHLGGFPVPARNIVDFSGGLVGLALFVHIERKDVLFLLLALQRVANERWLLIGMFFLCL